ncbi:MAG TPA: cytochrome c [Vicinamibacterales bacterium]
MIRATAFFVCLVLYSVPLPAQIPRPVQASAPAEGKEILTRKCFQCHAATMWGSLRQDRKAWESTLYRMVGRGALWSEAEINAMASFLAETRGPK